MKVSEHLGELWATNPLCKSCPGMDEGLNHVTVMPFQIQVHR